MTAPHSRTMNRTNDPTPRRVDSPGVTIASCRHPASVDARRLGQPVARLGRRRAGRDIVRALVSVGGPLDTVDTVTATTSEWQTLPGRTYGRPAVLDGEAVVDTGAVSTFYGLGHRLACRVGRGFPVRCETARRAVRPRQRSADRMKVEKRSLCQRQAPRPHHLQLPVLHSGASRQRAALSPDGR